MNINWSHVPIAQPPGKDTFALPNFASNGPKTNIPALIVLTKLYDAKVFLIAYLLLIVSILFYHFQ